MTFSTKDWWDQAIARNRAALLHIVAMLFFRAGLDEGGAEMLPRRAWRAILRVLRPAESAARRLIVIAARDISVEPPARRAAKPPSAIELLQAAGILTIVRNVDLGLARAWVPAQPAAPPPATSRIPAFPLSDPPRRFDTQAWNGNRPFPQDGFKLADPEEEISAAHLCRRLLSLQAALDDLPGHAKRLARRNARRKAARDHGAYIRPPLRRGHPPGWRRKPGLPVDDLLNDCHILAMPAVRLDTS